MEVSLFLYFHLSSSSHSRARDHLRSCSSAWSWSSKPKAMRTETPERLMTRREALHKLLETITVTAGHFHGTGWHISFCVAQEQRDVAARCCVDGEGCCESDGRDYLRCLRTRQMRVGPCGFIGRLEWIPMVPSKKAVAKIPGLRGTIQLGIRKVSETISMTRIHLTLLIMGRGIIPDVGGFQQSARLSLPQGSKRFASCLHHESDRIPF